MTYRQKYIVRKLSTCVLAAAMVRERSLLSHTFQSRQTCKLRDTGNKPVR